MPSVYKKRKKMILHSSKDNLVKKYEHALIVKLTEYRNRLSVETVK